jgi:hypothetical protein
MFNLGALATTVLNSIDNVAKETLEEPKVSATALRSRKKAESQEQGGEYEGQDAPASAVGGSGDATLQLQPEQAPPSGGGGGMLPVALRSNSNSALASMGQQTSQQDAVPSTSEDFFNMVATGDSMDPFSMQFDDNSSSSPSAAAAAAAVSSAPNSSSTAASFFGGPLSATSDPDAALKRQLLKKDQVRTIGVHWEM